MRNTYEIIRTSKNGLELRYYQDLTAMDVEFLQAKKATVKLVGERLSA